MDEWLDSINVPSEDRPKQNEWKQTTLLRKEDNRDHLIMFFDEDTNQLYVVEYFFKIKDFVHLSHNNFFNMPSRFRFLF